MSRNCPRLAEQLKKSYDFRAPVVEGCIISIHFHYILIGVIVFTAACGPDSTPEEETIDPTQYVKPLLFGHRGTILFRPENTMAAFDYAFDEGGDGIEIDVRRAATGELIAIHDSSLQRVTDNADDGVSQKTIESSLGIKWKKNAHDVA